MSFWPTIPLLAVALGLVLGALLPRRHGWLLIGGCVVGVSAWALGSVVDGYEDLEGEGFTAFLLLLIVLAVWAAGVGMGYAGRRLIRRRQLQ